MRIVLGILGFMLLAFSVHSAPMSTRPTGTQYGGAKSVLSFSKKINDLLAVSNVGLTTLFVKLNETGTSATATVSASVYDFVVPTTSTLILSYGEIGRFGVTSLSLYTADTTPTAVVVGW